MGDRKALLAEFVGTFGLIFMGAGAIVADSYSRGAVGLTGIALAHGVYLAVAISAVMRISGGHLNPAVTFGVLVGGRIKPAVAGGYWLAQLSGGIAAALLLSLLFPAVDRAATHLGTPMLATGIAPGAGILMEAVLTFFLVFVVFGTAVDPKAPQGLGGFAIGLTVAVDILAGGAITGASMNPARSFGPALVSGTWDAHLVYWVGPLVGGALAGALWGGYFLKGKQEA